MPKKSSRSKMNRCREIWRRFATSSTIHGLPYTILAPQGWMRIVWMLASITAMIFCCLQIGYLGMKYASKPTEIVKQVTNKSLLIYVHSFPIGQCPYVYQGVKNLWQKQWVLGERYLYLDKAYMIGYSVILLHISMLPIIILKNTRVPIKLRGLLDIWE